LPAADGDLAGSVAHEIENPLTCMLGNLEEIESELGTVEGAMTMTGGACTADAGTFVERVPDVAFEPFTPWPRPAGAWRISSAHCVARSGWPPHP